MAAAVPAALLVVGLASGVASAAPGDDITESCLETSQGGSPWVGLDEFAPQPTDYIPVPGDEGVQLAFDVRNKCDVPATFTIYSQNWEVAESATATVRGAIAGQTGQQVVIGPAADALARIVLQQKVLPQNVTTPIEYLVGIPRAETVQGFGINPGWGFQLLEDARTVVPAAPAELKVTPTAIEPGDTVTVSGTAEGGSTVTVTVGDQTCIAEADRVTGAFSCDLTITELGDHTVTVTAKNDVGTGPSATSTVKVAEATDPGDGGGSSAGSLGSLGSMDFLGSLGG